MDVIEDPIFKNVIIPQTVLQEVKQRSISCYQRLTQLINSPDRKFICFVNEFHRDVFVTRLDNESPNDRNDRAIREVCKYYNQHFPNTTVKTIMISDDVNNVRLAREQGLCAATCREYVESLNKPELTDRIAAKEKSSDSSEISEQQITDTTRKNKQIIFPEHIRLADIQLGIKSGRFFQGAFQSSRENYLEANVFLYENEKYPQIFIQGYKNLNRAVNDDIVAVELLPESEWATPTSLVLEEAEDVDVGDYVNEKEEDEVVIDKPDVKKLPTGRVVGIIKRNWRAYCGMLQVSDLPDATRHLFVPAEKRIPKIRIETRQSQVLKNQRIVVAIDCWPRDSRYPLGHFVRTLGPIGDKETENQVILLIYFSLSKL